MKIVFMGTPDFAVKPLQALITRGYEIVCVYTQPPRPKGRGQDVQLSPVHQAAEKAGITVRTPSSLKKDMETVKAFEALKAEVAIVAAYGLILPKAILDAPKYGCINIHASLLPRWRGAAPIQRAIEAGDTQTGITIMQMDEGLDTGAELAKKSLPITSKATAQSLHDALADMGASMIVEAMETLSKEGKMAAKPQAAEGVTYAAMLKKEDGRIDWSKSAEAIDRQIRAFTPWPGTYCLLPGGKRLKILEAVPAQKSGVPGTILDSEGHVACEKGALRLLKVQPENAKPMDITAAINGGYIKPENVLS